MGKVNVYLKRNFIVMLSLIAVCSVFLLGFTLFSHGYHYQNEEMEEANLSGIHTMYIISGITLALALIGVYGAYKEKKWALIVFAVGMILGSMFMTFIEVIGLAALQSPLSEGIKNHYLHMLPLTNASESSIDSMNEIQMHLQCCGLDQGYLDWGYNIPESCICDEESYNPCVAGPKNSSLSEHMVDGEPVMIYNQTCIPFLIEDATTSVRNALGLFLGLTLFWILSVVLCVFILCQLRKKDDVPVVVYSPEAKAGNYTVLADGAEYN
ncbi:tetraspanin-8-like isoform X1 [Etheostoma cragini]|uniref:tetraspanin-8-like isoform X1 n=1 Tax=Etheostoma cragini TaxID=417921 RepID=UPI00155F3095|nr:tetraspanin-8-like isoform X1 [Etheostoma cragini]